MNSGDWIFALTIPGGVLLYIVVVALALMFRKGIGENRRGQAADYIGIAAALSGGIVLGTFLPDAGAEWAPLIFVVLGVAFFVVRPQADKS